MSVNSTASNTRNSNPGSFFFVIENLPGQYTWQDLKDLIRREASHGIWTEMALYSNGKTGGKGHARVKRAEEARKLYSYLTTNVVENRRLRIHLWDISGSEARFLGCNCDSTSIHPTQSYPAQGLEVTQMALAPGWQVVTLASPMTASQGSYPTSPATSYATTSAPMPQPAAQAQVQLAAMQQAMLKLQLSPEDPRYSAMMRQYQQRTQALRTQQAVNQQTATTQASRYTYTSTGLPININSGAIRTESRGVFVSGLNYKARSKDVEALFGKAGEISKCEVQKDASTGKSKGKATIRYSSAAGARQAINMFNDKKYMDMSLRVRLDTEKTVVSPPAITQASKSTQPIIVNGSQTTQSRDPVAATTSR